MPVEVPCTHPLKTAKGGAAEVLGMQKGGPARQKLGNVPPVAEFSPEFLFPSLSLSVYRLAVAGASTMAVSGPPQTLVFCSTLNTASPVRPRLTLKHPI
jgi:hypothetical protein